MNKVVSFFNEVRSELQRMVWPSRDELVGSTIIVCILTVFFALILGGMDFIFEYLIRRIIF